MSAHVPSYWAATAGPEPAQLAPLPGDRAAEVAVLGGGYTGLAAAYRLAGDSRMNQPYGKRERQRYDIFYAANEDAPLVVYIHGGYWQRGDRKDYSFIARELNASGITVALPSYSLCPAVSVMEIADELQLCIAALWKQTKKHPVVVGHSAGGHLAAEMLSRDWSGFAGVPSHLVQRGCAISGVFDLAPLIGTSINQAVGLTAGTSTLESTIDEVHRGLLAIGSTPAA